MVNLNVYGADLAAFRDKVHKSNWALQTMLQTINVSLSLRNHASQEAILLELDRLKSSIDEALMASIRPIGGFSHRPTDHSDARVARNLRNLANAAKHFHGAASSTASTIRDGSRGGAPWQAFPGADIDVSLMGDLPSFRRERIEEFVREGRRHRRSLSSGLTSPSFSPPGEHAPEPRRGSRSPRRPTTIHSPRPLSFSGAVENVAVPASVTVITVDDDEDEDAEFERLFLDGLEELAKDRIKERDFDKAIEFLQEAMKREVGSKSDNEGFQNLQVQLALCYLLQHQWEMAEPIITGLAKNKEAADAVVCNLLHSMALVHLSRYLFDKALAVCREALLAKKKLLKRKKIDVEDYAQTQGLLVMIYEMKGEWMHAEVYQSQIPADFDYEHPKNEVDFITSHPRLLTTVLGDNIPDFSVLPPKVTPGLHELDGGGSDNCLTALVAPALRRSHTYNGASPLKVKFAQQLMYEADTSKIVYVPEPELTVDTSSSPCPGSSTSEEADDEASPTTPPEPEYPVRRRISRMLGGRRAQPLPPAKVSSPPPDKSADVPAFVPAKPAPKYRWINAMLGFKKPRNILRKTSHDDEPSSNALGGLGKPKEFKLLYMERMTPENVEQVTSPAYRRKFWSPESVGNCCTNTQEMDAGSDDSLSNGARESSTVLPEDDAEEGNFAFKNGVPYVDVQGLRLPCPQLEDVQEEEWWQSEDSSAAQSNRWRAAVELSVERAQHLESAMLCDPYLCRTDIEVEEYWETAMRARPTGVEARKAHAQSPIPTDMALSENEARVLLMLENHPRAHTSLKTDVTAATSSDNSEPSKRMRKDPRVAAAPVDPLLQSISSVLASLSEISDAEGRHAVKLDLEIMALQFENRFHDGLVNQDLQRAIKSLENDAVTVPANENDDSGYESMGNKKVTKDEGKARPNTKKVIVPKIKAKARPLAKKPKAKSPFADYTRALRYRTEKPRVCPKLATEPCNPPVQPISDETSNQPQQAQEAKLPLRKRFSFEKGQDEVVDADDAVAALRALVESGDADTIQSAIAPSVCSRSGLHQNVDRRSSCDLPGVKSRTPESPHSPSLRLSRASSVLVDEVDICPDKQLVCAGEGLMT